MQILDSVALVTGANRGIGRHFVQALLARGAAKVYATARTPSLVDIPGAQVLALDVTDPASVAAAAVAAPDVSLLINNAGISTFQNLVTGDLDEIHREMDTHFFGTLSVVRAFTPVLAASGAGAGGGAVLNMLSALSWFSYDGANAYSAAKAAQWSLTNGIRLELAAQGTLVTGLHAGSVDTEMMAGFDVPKTDPAEVARAGLDAIEANQLEVLVDDTSAQVRAALSGHLRGLYPSVVGD